MSTLSPEEEEKLKALLVSLKRQIPPIRAMIFSYLPRMGDVFMRRMVNVLFRDQNWGPTTTQSALFVKFVESVAHLMYKPHQWPARHRTFNRELTRMVVYTAASRRRTGRSTGLAWFCVALAASKVPLKILLLGLPHGFRGSLLDLCGKTGSPVIRHTTDETHTPTAIFYFHSSYAAAVDIILVDGWEHTDENYRRVLLTTVNARSSVLLSTTTRKETDEEKKAREVEEVKERMEDVWG